jgi:hypothetical protein
VSGVQTCALPISPTNTPVPPTNTPTNTPVATSTPTNTATSTAVATNTPTNTRIPASTPTNTPTPVPQSCLSFGQKVRLVVGILKRLSAHRGDRRYDPQYDVNHDGVIDIKDVMQVVQTPICSRHHDRHDD